MIIIAIYGLSGVVISALVALSIALWGSATSLDRASGTRDRERVVPTGPSPSLSSTVHLAACEWALPMLPGDGPLVQLRYSGWGITDAFTWVIDSKPVLPVARFHQTGWPFRAWECRCLAQGLRTPWPEQSSCWEPPTWLSKSEYFNGIPGPNSLPSTVGAAGRPPVPLRPIPLGLAANAAFFGVVLYVPSVLLGVARRAVRRRRNLCPSCGYSCAGLADDAVCPECGARG